MEDATTHEFQIGHPAIGVFSLQVKLVGDKLEIYAELPPDEPSQVDQVGELGRQVDGGLYGPFDCEACSVTGSPEAMAVYSFVEKAIFMECWEKWPKFWDRKYCIELFGQEII